MLNSKQKQYLRSMAMKNRASMQVGKAGITDAVVKQSLNEIEKTELLKISLLQNTAAEMDKVVAAFQSAEPRVELVQKIGRNVVLYKKAKEPKNRDLSAHVDRLFKANK